MDYTYQFEDHLREHRPSRLGQRLWWVPAAAGVGVVLADGAYLAAARSAGLSVSLAVALPFMAAALFLVAWAALSIADWTYPREKFYREAQHAAASKALAYILAGRRARGERPMPGEDPANGVFVEQASRQREDSSRRLIPAPARAAGERHASPPGDYAITTSS